MVLINCPECSGKVSTKATACPHCGAPVEKQAILKRDSDQAEDESHASDSSVNIPSKKSPRGEERHIREWYWSHGDEQHGPIGFNELRSMAKIGELFPHCLVWKEGMAEWTTASTIDGLRFPSSAAWHDLVTPTQEKDFAIDQHLRDNVVSNELDDSTARTEIPNHLYAVIKKKLESGTHPIDILCDDAIVEQFVEAGIREDDISYAVECAARSLARSMFARAVIAFVGVALFVFGLVVGIFHDRLGVFSSYPLAGWLVAGVGVLLVWFA